MDGTASDEWLFAELGITARAQEHVEQTVIDQALATTAAAAAAAATAPDGSAAGLAEQLLAVEQEAEAVATALAAQQQEEAEPEWESSGDEAAKAGERSNCQLETAIMRQHLAALQQQQEHLQQELSALPPEQQQLAQDHLQHLRLQLQQQHQQHGRGVRGRGRGSRRGGASSSRGRRQSAAAAGTALQDGAGTGAAGEAAAAGPSLNMALVETERDRLIRCGLLTPFDKLEGFDMRVQGGAAAQGPHQQQQHDPQQQPVGPQPPSQQDVADLQAPPQPQPHQAALQTVSSNRSQPSGAQGVVDAQWALLTRNTVQAPADGAAAAHVPADLADIAHQVGRGGLPLSHLIAKTAQQTVEVGVTSRPRAILMEAGEVPKQERDIIKVNPMLWRAGGAAQHLPGVAGAAAKRPRRASTLPRQKKRRHGVAALRQLSEAVPAAGAGPGRKRQRRAAVGQEEGGSDSGHSSWEDDWTSSEADEEGGSDSEQQQQVVPQGVHVQTAAAGAADHDGQLPAVGGPSGARSQELLQSQQQQDVVDLVGADSDSEPDAAAGPGSEDEYIPSDVDVSARGRDAAANIPTAAAAAAAGGGGDNDDAMLEDDLSGLVPEGTGGLGSSSSRGSRGRRGRRQAAAVGSTRRRKGRQKQRQGATGSASTAAAAGGSSDAVPSASDAGGDTDALLQADAGDDVRDELADYDDLDDAVYELRMQRYVEQQQQQQQAPAGQQDANSTGAGAGTAAAAAAVEDAVFGGGFRVPASVWSGLFDYQRTGVKWLWELHNQRAGGIIGDEMGLGKTIQVIAYLAGLHASGMWRPTLVVAPATVLRQWMSEMRAWYPPLRVYLFHESGRSPPGSSRPDKAGLLDLALSHHDCALVLTTYEQLRLQRELLLPVRWGVAVLDEGHKIRNPDAEVTLAAKQLQTVHRIIMSGSPIQNRLSELWSLFDFIFPGKLGTLPVFTAQFAIPITVGGYTNASKLQVQTAYRCAVVLRDLISPYLLRRRKADVATQLPKKTETVLFCSLTETQRDLYRAYLSSGDVSEILSGQRQALAGIDVLRKICNHPDLLQRTQAQGSITYGEPSRSGKLLVLVKVLAAWQAEGHKVLLFTQTQQMLDIIEKHVVEQGYNYHRMDGNTPIATRGRLMDDFNTNPDRFLFLLTTKVGGLGVNLTGANRVLIYDPDWNPSTDSQARERAWRIGQGRPVTIYRLITSGTIEEKVYHRQIYKSYLTNKVLQDPRQRRFFAAKDITDLFTLADEHGAGGSKRGLSNTPGAAAAATPAAAATETGRIFADVVQERKLHTAPPPAAAAAATARAGSSSNKRAKVAGRGQPPTGRGLQQSSGRSRLTGLQQQQPGDDAEASSPPLSPTARATAGLAVVAPAQDVDVDVNQAGASAAAAAAAAAADSSGRGSSAEARKGHSSRVGGVAAAAGNGSGGEAADDARVLRDLFEGAGIKSLMDHTSIEGAHDPEAKQADADAAKVAERAAEKLRQSRLACQAAAVHVPTWTGRHGAAGLQAATGRTGGSGNSSRRSSPATAAAAAGSGGGTGAAPHGRFGRVVNPLLTARPLYNAPPQHGGAAPPPDGAAGSSVDTGAAPGGGGSGGSAGTTGGPLNQPRAFSGQLAGTTGGAAPSSAALLAQLRQRQASIAAVDVDLPPARSHMSAQLGSATQAGSETYAAAAAGAASGSGRQQVERVTGSSEDAAAVGLAGQIADFIAAAGNAVRSETLVAHFGEVLQPSEMPLFKQLLRQVARMQPAADGCGKVWVLKQDDSTAH